MKSTVNLLCCCVAWSAVQILVPEVEANADAAYINDDSRRCTTAPRATPFDGVYTRSCIK